ncbi:MAG: uracil-DNA glycosylase [Burkholderia sp.]|nr:uracil-DNA glycosylase [Burkholderia sp.]
MKLVNNILEEMGLIHLWVRRKVYSNTYVRSPEDDTSMIEVSSQTAEHVFKNNNILELDTPLPSYDSADEDIVASKLNWNILRSRVVNCMCCHLCERRMNTVFGIGDRQADWMLIGEAPGEMEDLQGEPFVGQAGKLLDNMLKSLSLNRKNNVYITNLIKCRPPGNRNPEPNEIANCIPYLRQQIELVKPKLIVTLGRFAGQTLLQSTSSIKSMRGRVHAYKGIPVVVTYHPAYLLRNLNEKSKAWIDLCLARDIFSCKNQRT